VLEDAHVSGFGLQQFTVELQQADEVHAAQGGRRPVLPDIDGLPAIVGWIEPVWIILLSQLFAIIWTRLGTRAPTTPRKFGYGVIGMGAAFLLFLPMTGTESKAVQAFLVLFILAVFAISELLLSPIGLSVTTKLAPEAFRAQMMALYFFFVGLAKYHDPAREFAYFGIIGAVAIVAGVIVFAPRALDQPRDGGRALKSVGQNIA
jgi:dipeptide/tripeptide permease